jgi:hypothetical protein
MPPELPIEDAGRVPFEVNEEALFAAIAGANEVRDHDREGLAEHSRTIAQPAAAPEEIEIDQRDRVIAPTDREGPVLRVAIVVSGLIAAVGLAWILTGTRGSNFSGIGSRSSEVIAPVPSASADTVSSKGDRLQTVPIPAGANRKTGEETTTEPQERSKLSPSASGGRKRSVAAVAATAPSPGKHSPVAPQRRASVEIRAEEPEGSSRLTPVPETRPTTIEGWTVRDVVNGTAILEGPNGVWRVVAGNTVPDLGRIDSIVRWGNRWIVATSSGLVTTP